MKHMSKLFTAVFVFALAACMLAGCSGKSSDTSGADAGTASDTPAADSGTTSEAPAATSAQTITIPASYFVEAVSPEEAVAQLEAAGCSDVADNGDGTYTVTIDADSYNKMVSAQRDYVMQCIDTAQDGSTYPNVDSITYDENFTKMEVKLNTDMPGLEDTYALSAVGVPAATYQQIAGLPIGCEVSLVLADGTVQQVMAFPL